MGHAVTGPQIWMFSGQGSQYYQMGADLYANDPAFRAAMDRCSAHVAPAIGLSLTELIFRPRVDRFEPFDRLLHTHPALFSIQFSIAQSLLSLGPRPDIILGYSLGEWVAQAVAEVMPAETVLDLLLRQARQVEAELPSGGMLAILDSPDLTDRHPDWFRGTSIAARNFDRHFVISGPTASIDLAERELKQQNITAQRLPVSYAFHSPAMDGLRTNCMESVQSVRCAPPSVRLWSSRGDEVTHLTPAETLWRAVREPTAFNKVVSMLEAGAPPTYIDCGPSGTLAAFAKYNLSRDAHHRCISIVTPFGRNLEKLRALPLPPHYIETVWGRGYVVRDPVPLPRVSNSGASADISRRSSSD
jgi:acyl transferase domain-containing protein